MSRAYFGQYHDGDPRIKELFNSLWTSPPNRVSIDVETTSTVNRTPLGFGIGLPGNHSFYFDFHEQDLPYHLVVPGPNRKIYQNAPFDVGLDCLGQFGADIDKVDDTVILTRYLNLDTELSLISSEVENQTWNMGAYFQHYGVKSVPELPWAALAEKCCRDCLVTLDVWDKYRPMVPDAVYNQEQEFLRILLHMSHRGIKIDQDRLKAIDQELENDMNLYFGQARPIGFNPNSGEQVAYMLSTQGIQIPWKRGKKKASVDDWFLSGINHPWAALTRVARRTSKLHSTYSHKWLGKDRVYSHFTADALTKRVKSSRDNLQNLPTGAKPLDYVPAAGPIRSIFVPDNDGPQLFQFNHTLHKMWCGCPYPDMPHYTKWDDSQIELRCFAYLAQDEEMQFFLNYKLTHPDAVDVPDFHTETQRAIGAPTRRQAKVMVFGGLLYGGSDEIIMKNTGIRDIKAIQYARAGFNQRWPKSAKYIVEQQHEALRTMKVYTIDGNEIHLDRSRQELTDKHIMNMGVAIPSQASAAEIVKRQFNYLVAADEVDIDLIMLMIHDEAWQNGVYRLPEYELSHMSPVWTPIEYEYRTRGG